MTKRWGTERGWQRRDSRHFRGLLAVEEAPITTPLLTHITVRERSLARDSVNVHCISGRRLASLRSEIRTHSSPRISHDDASDVAYRTINAATV